MSLQPGSGISRPELSLRDTLPFSQRICHDIEMLTDWKQKLFRIKKLSQPIAYPQHYLICTRQIGLADLENMSMLYTVFISIHVTFHLSRPRSHTFCLSSLRQYVNKDRVQDRCFEPCFIRMLSNMYIGSSS